MRPIVLVRLTHGGSNTQHCEHDTLAPARPRQVPHVQLGAVVVDGAHLAVHHDLATQEVQRLDAGGALPQRRDACVTQDLLLAVLLDVAVATVHLHAHAGGLDADLGEEALQDGRQEAHGVIHSLHALGVAGELCLHHQIRQQGALEAGHRRTCERHAAGAGSEAGATTYTIARPPSATAFIVRSMRRTSGCTMMGSAAPLGFLGPVNDRMARRSLA